MSRQTKNEAIEAALSQGLQVYFASTHVGGRFEFLAHSWEEGGFSVDAAGNPRCDAAANTVARFSVRDIDPQTDAALCEEWYG